MAADWIKMRWNLRSDYRVRRIASRCTVTVPHAVGALHALWSIFDEHSNDGKLRFCSRESIDSDTQTPGLVAALEEIGWARWHDEGETLELVDWLEHNGKTAKERMQVAARQSKHRNSVTANRDKPVTVDRDMTVTREEKRREENKDKEKEAYASSKKATKFVRPTVPEIGDYCDERDNGIDAQQFYDHYESKGWMVGKSPMKDWRACVRTWERNGVDRKPSQPEGNDVFVPRGPTDDDRAVINADPLGRPILPPVVLPSQGAKA